MRGILFRAESSLFSFMQSSVLITLLVFSALHGTSLTWIDRAEASPKNPVIGHLKSVVFITSRALLPSDIYAITPHKGTGPGFIIDREGHVACMASILSDIHSIEVTIHDRSFWPAKLIGTDPETGLALLKIEAPARALSSLMPLTFPDRWNLSLGETVWTIGITPTGKPAVARGIVSVPERTILVKGKRWPHLIQTSIPVNSSFHGAPLFDSTGKLVGVNTTMEEGKQSGFPGFAIPVDRVKQVVEELKLGQKSPKTWLGTSFITLDERLAKLLNLPTDKGLMLVNIEKGSPAAKAGLHGSSNELRLGNKIYPLGGDIIVAVDRKEISTPTDLNRVLAALKPGDRILLSIYRDKRLMRIPVELAAKP